MNTSVLTGHKARRLLGLGTLTAAVFLTLGLAGCGDKKPKDGDVDMGCHECMDGDEESYPDVEPDDDGYITDPRDGKRYRTIKIGGLMWMAENLNYAMPEYSGEGYDYGYRSWCYDESDANCAKYGRLYDWSTAANACLPGWRLPSVQDWDNLFVAAGGSFDAENHRWNAAGSKLKSKTGWKDKGNGTDNLGFSALPGGFRDDIYNDGGYFKFVGEGGYWWASDEKKNGNYRAMGWDMSHVNENRLRRDYGLSVRYVRGDTDPPAPGKGRPVPAAPEINAALPVGTPYTGWYKPKAKNFTISTADHLAGLAKMVNDDKDFNGVTITLSGDIDLSAYGRGSAFNDGKGWIPIGGYGEGSQSFMGVFDGNGQKIRGLYINDPELHGAGLFGVIDGTVKNLGVVDVNVTGYDNVGGIVGTAGGRVTDCYSTGAVNGTDNIGGVVGYISSEARLSNSYSTAAVTGELHVGGVVGHVYNKVAVTGCYSTGAVRGATDVGGVAGYAYESQLSSCYSTGTVSGRAGRVGGVAGRLHYSSASNCYSIGAVSGREGAGGVAGSIIYSSQLSNCAALNPSVKGTSATGRVVGYDYSNDGLSNNTAFIGLKDIGGRTERWTGKAGNDKDGQNITTGEIADDGTIGNRFTEDSGWTIGEGKLPGLGGSTVEIPEHLR